MLRYSSASNPAFDTRNASSTAAFLILILGGAIVAAAITLELSLSPPFWVHVLLWIPLSAAAVLLALRVSKAGLLALEYRNKAREFRSEGPR